MNTHSFLNVCTQEEKNTIIVQLITSKVQKDCPYFLYNNYSVYSNYQLVLNSKISAIFMFEKLH